MNPPSLLCKIYQVLAKTSLRKLTQGFFKKSTTRKLPSASASACYDSMTQYDQAASQRSSFLGIADTA